MTESFADWLTKQVPIRKQGVIGTGNVSVRALGEWALDAIDNQGYFPYSTLDWELQNIKNIHKDKLLLQITIACLGEKTVKRRLKEAGK